MSDERNPWDRMDDEPDLWYGRFIKFMRLGSKRSVAIVYRKEHPVKPRQTSLNIDGDWYAAAKRWRWEERARARDEYDREEEDRVIADGRNKVIRSNYALMHKRIRLLEKILNKLVKMTEEDDKIWLKETKTTTCGTGENNTQIVIEKITFNAPLFLLIDKYLGSIAAEMGERVKKKAVEEESSTEFEIELTGKSPDEDKEE